MSRRRDVLRRLGAPRFRHVCQRCRRYVPAVRRAWVVDYGAPDNMRPVSICVECKAKVDEANQEATKRHVENEFGLDRANHEHQLSSLRSSRREYLIACEKMKREWGIR